MSLEASTREMEQAFRKTAAELAEEFRTAADELDEHVKNIRIARISGSSTSAAGGVTAFLGLVLAPVTLGVSLIATGVGTGVALLGALTSAGSELTGFILEKIKMEDMEKKWKQFQKLHKKCFPQAKPKDFIDKSSFIKDLMATGRTVAPTPSSGVKFGIQSGKAGGQALKLAAGATRDEAAVAAAAAKGVTVVASKTAVLLNVVGVGISVIDIVSASVDLYKEKKCPAGKILRQLAAELDELAKVEF